MVEVVRSTEREQLNVTINGPFGVPHHVPHAFRAGGRKVKRQCQRICFPLFAFRTRLRPKRNLRSARSAGGMQWISTIRRASAN
jgi:hypothetical protein